MSRAFFSEGWACLLSSSFFVIFNFSRVPERACVIFTKCRTSNYFYKAVLENNFYNTLLRKIKQVENSLSVWLRFCEKSLLICLFLLSSITKSSAKKKYFYGRQKNHKTLKNVTVNTGSQSSQEFEEENPATFLSKLGERENGSWGDIPTVRVICDSEKKLSQVLYMVGRCFLSLQNMLYLQNFNLCLTIGDSISLGALSKKFLQRNSFCLNQDRICFL